MKKDKFARQLEIGMYALLAGWDLWARAGGARIRDSWPKEYADVMREYWAEGSNAKA